MSAKNTGNIAQGLAAATCSLLGTAATLPVLAQEQPEWEFDTALLYYGEDGGRVQDLSLNLLARRLFADDRILSVGLAVDSLTGATPSGAVPQDELQTFTRPSGESTYQVAAGEMPLDDTFLDTRYALTASWRQPLGRDYAGTAGLSFSTEYDYTHVGANFALSRDFNKRNTTVSLGLALARDELDPEGGAPLPLGFMSDVRDLSERGGTENKDVVDLLLGVTQAVNENLLVQLNYSLSDGTGYLNDPYKILSVVDPLSGDAILRTPAPGAAGPLHQYRFESRPDKRTKHSLFGQGKYFMGGKVLDMSYRYMTDDWGIDSHTLETKLNLPLGDTSYIEPHLRFYTQSEADFYRASLVDGEPLPQFASADYRLGSFDAITAGLKYGWRTSSGKDFAVRLEYYRQDGEIPTHQLIGSHDQSSLYPDLDAVILNFSFGFGM
ncbi:MAG: DUF3570 domain-containing protein [Woeseia sp.]